LKHTPRVQTDFENFLPHTQSIDACLEEPSSISWPYNLVKGIYLNIMPTLPLLRGDYGRGFSTGIQADWDAPINP
tara:strand:- start:1121 stop:1345 length:225 start_codon:yes stop_codon:yes gene_type:complete